jgi:hypothetical protein
MKHLLWAVPALLLGLLLGSWGPRADLRALRDELKTAREHPAGGNPAREELGRAKALLGMSDAVIRQRASERKAKAPAPRHSVSSTNAHVQAATTGAVTVAGAASDAATQSVVVAGAAGGMEKQLEQAAELWSTRAELARNSFVSNAGLTTPQANRFDVLVAAMNVRLEHGIRQWADTLKKKENLSPEDGVRLINDLSAALVVTYDEMDRAMPAGWRTPAGKEFSMLDFIDPSVALPLVQVEDKLKDPGHLHGAEQDADADGEKGVGGTD